MVDFDMAHHNDCFACGKDNKDGLQLNFDYDSQSDTVSADFIIEQKYQGYQGVVHGGITATVLDCAMVHCLFARKISAVTIEMSVKYRHPVKIGQHSSVKAELINSSHGMYRLIAKIIQDGQIKATAKGRFFASR